MSDYEYLGQRKHQPIVGRTGETPWDLAAEHRFRWMRLIPPRESGQRRGMIGIVGVEDKMAVDITKMLSMFHEVHLIDPDESNARSIIAEQSVLEPHRVHHHWKSSTYAGIEPSLAEYAEDPSESNFQQVLKTAAEHTWGDIGQYTVMVSSSILTPMLAQLPGCFKEHPDRFRMLLETVRGRHIELMLNHTTPGGAMYLLIQLVCSDTIPQIIQRPGDLFDICNRAIETQNFHAGCNPYAIEEWLRNSKGLREISSGFRTFEPWIYEQPDRHAIYYAIRMNRLE